MCQPLFQVLGLQPRAKQAYILALLGAVSGERKTVNGRRIYYIRKWQSIRERNKAEGEDKELGGRQAWSGKASLGRSI